MKKVLIAAATAGLMTLAACQPTATNNTTVADNAAMGDEANAAAYNDTMTSTDNAMPATDNAVETNTTGNTN